jgi:hypothetical protein
MKQIERLCPKARDTPVFPREMAENAFAAPGSSARLNQAENKRDQGEGGGETAFLRGFLPISMPLEMNDPELPRLSTGFL